MYRRMRRFGHSLLYALLALLSFALCASLHVPIKVHQKTTHRWQTVQRHGRTLLEANLSSTRTSFTVPLGLGVPPQYFDFLVDTGSSDVGVPAQDCKRYDGIQKYENRESTGSCYNAYFQPSQSREAGKVSCSSDFLVCPSNYLVNCFGAKERSCICGAQNIAEGVNCYGDGSGFRSTLWEDKLTIAGRTTAAKQIFSLYTTQMDKFSPILGMGFRLDGGSRSPTVLDTLLAGGDISQKLFAMCTSGLYAEEGKLAGQLILGEVGSEDMYEGPIRYTPIAPDSNEEYTRFSVHVRSIKLGWARGSAPTLAGNYFSAESAGTLGIVDSGTTDFVLPEDTYYDFMNRLQSCESCQYLDHFLQGRAVAFTSDEVNMYPSIFIELEDQMLELPAKRWMRLYNQGGTVYFSMLSIQILPASVGNLKFYIFGLTVLRNYHVVYDFSSLKIGFAISIPSNCTWQQTSEAQGQPVHPSMKAPSGSKSITTCRLEAQCSKCVTSPACRWCSESEVCLPASEVPLRGGCLASRGRCAQPHSRAPSPSKEDSPTPHWLSWLGLDSLGVDYTTQVIIFVIGCIVASLLLLLVVCLFMRCCGGSDAEASKGERLEMGDLNPARHSYVEAQLAQQQYQVTAVTGPSLSYKQVMAD